MRQLRQTLRLHLDVGLSLRETARLMKLGKTTVGDIVLKARAAAVDWATAQDLSDEELERRLYAGIREGAVLMTDGYEVYDTVAETHRLVHLACWTHCRRYFHNAVQALPKEQRGPTQLAARFVALIGQLYEVEAQARRDGVNAEELGRRRRHDSQAVLADIETLLLAKQHAVVPKSLLGQVLHYRASQWSKLKRYVDDGRCSIDNNAQESAGRRNWLFADTVAGANASASASANLYSLLQTCQVNGIDGYRYLHALFSALSKAQMADDYAALMPWRIEVAPA